MHRLLFCVVLFQALGASCLNADVPWVADQGDGTFKNPVLYADYSDPDVIRVGEDYYLTSSSFSHVPALPILHSRDLVNWQIISHAVPRLPKRFDTVQHGNGIWAPCLRYHDGYFWIFVGDPDLGILMTKAKDPRGPWSELHLVQAGKGLIDPSPLWDDDGKAYLVHAYARSRAGVKSIIVAREMEPDGTRLLGEEHLLIDGRNGDHETIEGPKFYKINDQYYILAPAGGVTAGWQVAARADSPFGPYEVKRVLEQGSTDINGPHQGGLIETPEGEWWFMHFQDREAYGRIVHLNPVQWKQGWPEMGVDFDGNQIGEPVRTFQKPKVTGATQVATPQTTDEFDERLNLAWQWQANPQPGWHTLSERPGWLRLHAQQAPRSGWCDIAHLVAQKFPAPNFSATTKLDTSRLAKGSQAGMLVMGTKLAGLMVEISSTSLRLLQVEGGRDKPQRTVAQREVSLAETIWLRAEVQLESRVQFQYSTDGRQFVSFGEPFSAAPGHWVGAKLGLVCLGEQGWADFDYFRIAGRSHRSQPKQTTVVLVGDSTVASNRDGFRYQGWGWSLQNYMQDQVVVKNHAANGRSSKSFRTEGRWKKALADHPDVVLIQFGHNDNPGKGPERETDPAPGGSYRKNLQRYVREARAAGAVPVLVSPTTRRFYLENGQIDPQEGNVPYAEATLAVAEELDCPVIDLNRLTRELFNRLGEAGSNDLQPSGDRTHFTHKGSRTVAAIVARQLATKSNQLKNLVQTPGLETY